MKVVPAFLLSTFFGLSAAAQAVAQPPPPHAWQKLQMPAAPEVLARWKSPPPEYGPEPYYGLNGPVTLDVVRHDLDTMHRLGYQAVTVQYGYGAPFAYLSPAYFTFFRGLVDEAKKRKMRVWIVDDAGYPSGFAGGMFSKLHPQLRMQALIAAQKLSVQGGATIDQPVAPDTVAITAIGDTGKTLSVPFPGGAVHWIAPAGDWTLYVVAHAFRTSPTRSDTNPERRKDGSQSLEDYMNPAATAEYLRYTHDAYKAAVGDEFGKTILGFRGDEPDYSISGLPWTQALFARFQQEKGYDIRPYLAAFLQPKGAILTTRQARAKADYYDVFSLMFRDGFFKPQGIWCAQNGLEYQVHLNHEEAELELVRSEGSFFRDMRYVEVPGIDTIWHQIWTDTISDFPRLASSAAHIYGHPRAFTESFAAYRPQPDVAMARYILNEEMVRGVNLIETMYYPASSTPGHGGPSALMLDPAYPALLTYVRRLSYLMSMGRPDAHVALLLPTSSLWFNDASADSMFVSTERLLSEHQIDFDIVDEDSVGAVLKPGRGTLETMSGNRYTSVLVPNATALSGASLARLRQFAASGGHVLFLGGTPSLIEEGSFLNGRTVTPADFSWAHVCTEQLAPTPTPPAQPPASPPPAQVVPAALLAALRNAVPTPDLELTTPSSALRTLHRKLGGAAVFFLFNESAAPLEDQLTLRAQGHTVEFWEPQTGAAEPASAAMAAHGLIHLPLALQPYETKVIVVQ
jgi:hypothetical protein